MYRWYVINTYSGHENKVKHNLEHRVQTMSQDRNVRQVVVPTEQVSEMKDGQKVQTEKRTMPGYVLVNMDLNEAVSKLRGPVDSKVTITVERKGWDKPNVMTLARAMIRPRDPFLK